MCLCHIPACYVDISSLSSFEFLLSAACLFVICQFSCTALFCMLSFRSPFHSSKEPDLILTMFLTFDLKLHMLCSRCSTLYYK
ncbi:hypothetical protein BDV10DRAFT_36890 [Aspergillus recurvatus]